jgi:GTP cyclohydrolase IB
MDCRVTTPTAMEDVQGRADSRQIPINKVGIKDIATRCGSRTARTGEQHTVANFNMYVNLPHNFKGTHMSRFVEMLHQHEREISVESLPPDAGGDDARSSRRRPATSR